MWPCFLSLQLEGFHQVLKRFWRKTSKVGLVLARASSRPILVSYVDWSRFSSFDSLMMTLDNLCMAWSVSSSSLQTSFMCFEAWFLNTRIFATPTPDRTRRSGSSSFDNFSVKSLLDKSVPRWDLYNSSSSSAFHIRDLSLSKHSSTFTKGPSTAPSDSFWPCPTLDLKTCRQSLWYLASAACKSLTAAWTHSPT